MWWINTRAVLEETALLLHLTCWYRFYERQLVSFFFCCASLRASVTFGYAGFPALNFRKLPLLRQFRAFEGFIGHFSLRRYLSLNTTKCRFCSMDTSLSSVMCCRCMHCFLSRLHGRHDFYAVSSATTSIFCIHVPVPYQGSGRNVNRQSIVAGIRMMCWRMNNYFFAIVYYTFH